MSTRFWKLRIRAAGTSRYLGGSNLVAGDANDALDVFVRDRKRHVTRRVSVGPGGAQANGRSLFPAVSGGGRYVAFSA